jgi:hypothetical protein
MRRLGLLLVVLGALIGAGSPVAAAQTGELVAVEDLLRDSVAFAGVTVSVEGELVGDYGFRHDGSMWTQLNDDSYARLPLVDGGPRSGGNVGIGVRMSREDAAGLDPVGGYRLRGPLVRLTGTWKHHDSDRGGESYLEVAGIDVIESGRRLEEGPDWPAVIVGLALLAVSGLLWRGRPRED